MGKRKRSRRSLSSHNFSIVILVFPATSIMFRSTTLLLVLLASSSAFTIHQPLVHQSTLVRQSTSLNALTSAAIPEGEREILDGPDGPVLVTKVAGAYYAVDATCPHLNLPMKKGKISVEGGVPSITCSFHNSCFELESGKCTKWVTGALGKDNKLVAGVMGKMGGEKKDLKAYTVTEQEDGSLVIE
jgi:nitrite reductase/ring-hydroxylating ferredoxin subunit